MAPAPLPPTVEQYPLYHPSTGTSGLHYGITGAGSKCVVPSQPIVWRAIAPEEDAASAASHFGSGVGRGQTHSHSPPFPPSSPQEGHSSCGAPGPRDGLPGTSPAPRSVSVMNVLENSLGVPRFPGLSTGWERKRTAGPAHLQVCLCNTAPSCLGALRGRQAHGQSMDEAGQRMRALEDGVGERREGYRGRRMANVTDIL
ncbi:unnamed protein product [Arctogadus glacialis]